MKNYAIEASEKTPAISLDGERGVIEIRGKSVPEDSFNFFEPMKSWLDEYVIKPAPSTEVIVALEYFNTSSAKVLLEVFKLMNQLHKTGQTSMNIRWVYEEDDDDMLEAGHDYQRTIDVPIHFEAIEAF